VPLPEDYHRLGTINGFEILARLGSLANNIPRLAGICSLSEGIAALAHDQQMI
jgi:hypothetical protein